MSVRFRGVLAMLTLLALIGTAGIAPADGQVRTCTTVPQRLTTAAVMRPIGWAWRELTAVPQGWFGTVEWSGGDGPRLEWHQGELFGTLSTIGNVSTYELEMIASGLGTAVMTAERSD